MKSNRNFVIPYNHSPYILYSEMEDYSKTISTQATGNARIIKDFMGEN